MKALLVDLDDTLLDYTGDVDLSWREACLAVAVPAGLDLEIMVTAIARARRLFWSDPERHRIERTNMVSAWRKIVAHGLTEVGAPNEQLAAEIVDDYALRRWKRMELFPEVHETLGRLRERGVPLALVTNGDRGQQRRKIEQFDLARFFDVILIEGEFGAGKPDDRVYRHVLDSLRISASEAWMVGDNLEWDVVAPQRLGMRGVWVDALGQGVPEGEPARPHAIIQGFSEILTVLPATDPAAEIAPPMPPAPACPPAR
jgi:putative hydrolase of the HAD superfamily